MPLKIKTAFIFAAGLGRRMLPLTKDLPKPLIKVADIALIDRIILQLVAIGITRILINTHYLAEMLTSHLEDFFKTLPQDIVWRISYEPNLLETGGGVVNQLAFFENKPFYTINSDMIWMDTTISPFALLEQNWSADKMGLLLLKAKDEAIGYNGIGDFTLRIGGQLERKDGMSRYPYVFPGIQILSPKLFDGRNPGDVFSLNQFYKNTITTGPDAGLISNFYGAVYDGKWLHVGDPEGLAKAEEYFKMTR